MNQPGRPVEPDLQRPEPAPVAAPWWFELLALTAAVGLAVAGTVGLALALFGAFDASTTLLVSAPLVAAGVVLLFRALPRAVPSRSATLAALLALAVAGGFFAFAAERPSQNVLVDRDPGSYTNTARWLARDGSLEQDARGTAFAGVAGLSFVSQATYEVGRPAPVGPGGDETEGSGRLEFQFNHLTSVVLAIGYEIGGPAVMFRLPALAVAAGLLLVYAAAVRVTRRPLVALLAPVLLAFATPMLYVARNTYSEPFTLIPLWGALILLTAFHHAPRIPLAALGGVLLGTTVAVRIDALLYVILAIVLAGLSIGTAADPDLRARRRRGWLVAAAVGLVPAAIGTYDLYQRSGAYVDDLDQQLGLLRLAFVAVVVLTLGLVHQWSRPRFDRVRGSVARWRIPLAAPAAAVVGLGLLAGWLVRPEVQDARLAEPIPTVATMQERQGLPVDAYASYAEDTLRWMGWYLGWPALALAIAALAGFTFRAVRGRLEPAGLATVVLTLAAGGLYWWDPNITPDQLWATRRFAPAVFPALAVMAAAGLAAIADLDPLRRPLRGRLAAPVVVVLGVGLVWPAAATTRPVQKHTMQPGFVVPVETICDQLPDDAALLAVGFEPSVLLQQTFRGWCGVPTAGIPVDPTPASVAAIAQEVAANGFTPYLVGMDRPLVSWLAPPGGPEPFETVPAYSTHNARPMLVEPPHEYGGTLTLVLHTVPALVDAAG